MTEKFLNAYHFLPLDDGVAPVTEGDALGSRPLAAYGVGSKGRATARVGFGPLAGDGHARYVEGRHSGVIRCRLRTCTPTVVGGRLIPGREATPDADGSYNVLEPFLIEGEPAIPATSLKGMIGAAFEALSGSALRVLSDRPVTFRKSMREALHALGRLVRGADGAWVLEPLTLPLLKPFGSTVLPNRSIWRDVFKDYANLKVLVGNYKNLKSRTQENFVKSILSTNNIGGELGEYVYASIAFAGGTLNEFERSLRDIRGDLHYSKHGGDQILGQKLFATTLLSKVRRHSSDVRGFLRVLGVEGRGMEDITKKHEVFIPYPEEYEGAIRRQRLPVSAQALGRFEAMARERAEKNDNARHRSDDRGAEDRTNLPFMPLDWRTHRTRPEDWRLSDDVVAPAIREGQLVYFDVERVGDDIVVSELSFSAIWRDTARLPDGGPASTRSFFRSVDPDVLPMSEARTVVTPAERLLGFVSEGAKDSIGPRALAGRLRFGNACLASRPEDGEPFLEGDLETPDAKRLVRLKELSGPKPPSPAFYFKRALGRGEAVGAKRSDLSPGIAIPQGRKVYLHQDPAGPVAEPWRTRVSTRSDLGGDEAAAHRKTAVQPLRSGLDFTFTIRFDNLSDDELALLVHALAPTDDFRHKLGYGKPIGLGTVEITVEDVETIDRIARYGESPFEARRVTGLSVADLRCEGDRLARTLCPAAQHAFLEVGRAHPGAAWHGQTVLSVPLTREQMVSLNKGSDESERETFAWFVANVDPKGRDGALPEALRPLAGPGMRRSLDETTLSAWPKKSKRDDPTRPPRSRPPARPSAGDLPMRGTLKFFSAEKNYGFIVPDDGGRDVFLHGSIVGPDKAWLRDGIRLAYDVGTDRSERKQATRISPADAPLPPPRPPRRP